MTNEEAIKMLNTLYSTDVYINDALDLAIKALEKQPQVTVFCENADEKTTDELKTELERVNDEFMKDYKRVKHTSLGDVGKVCDVCAFRNKNFERACEECRNHDTFIFDGYVKKVDGEK